MDGPYRFATRTSVGSGLFSASRSTSTTSPACTSTKTRSVRTKRYCNSSGSDGSARSRRGGSGELPHHRNASLTAARSCRRATKSPRTVNHDVPLEDVLSISRSGRNPTGARDHGPELRVEAITWTDTLVTAKVFNPPARLRQDVGLVEERRAIRGGRGRCGRLGGRLRRSCNGREKKSGEHPTAAFRTEAN